MNRRDCGGSSLVLGSKEHLSEKPAALAAGSSQRIEYKVSELLENLIYLVCNILDDQQPSLHINKNM